MSVYVGPAIWPKGRMKMCHMMADTTEELMNMARHLNLKPEWIQNPGGPSEHFDVGKAKRRMAIKFGAEPVSDKWLVVNLVRRRRIEDIMRGLDSGQLDSGFDAPGLHPGSE